MNIQKPFSRNPEAEGGQCPLWNNFALHGASLTCDITSRESAVECRESKI